PPPPPPPPPPHNSLFKTSCTAAVVIGLITHAFAYFNATYFHDRSGMFMPILFDSAKRAKWMAQYIDAFTVFAYLPWLFGVLTLIFFVLSVYMIADILEIRYALNVWLIAGVCITNASVINAHMYWPHEILAALPLALASAWLWNKEKLHAVVRVGVGAVSVSASLACYGAYSSVAPCIVVIALIFALVDGQEWKKLFRRGIEYIVTFLTGLVFYYIVLRLFLHFQDISLLDYANESRLVDEFPGLFEIVSLMRQAWYSAVVSFHENAGIRLMLILSISLLVVQTVRQRSKLLPRINMLFMIFLMVIFPLSVGLIHVMAFGKVHWLMKFTYVMPYIGMVILLDREEQMMLKGSDDCKKITSFVVAMLSVLVLIGYTVFMNNINGRLRVICFAVIACAGIYVVYLWILERFGSEIQEKSAAGNCPKTVEGSVAVFIVLCSLTVLLCVKIYHGVLTANMAYIQLDKMDTANKSFVTRLLGRVESCEGFEGDEIILLLGDINDNAYISAEDFTGDSTWDYWDDEIAFGDVKNGLTNTNVLKALMRTDTGCPLSCQVGPVDIYSSEEQKIIDEMPVYPKEGSVKKIRYTIVVKLSEEQK
ncbi:MAG: glucosyltransferase domain-containing protein, partial [Lachnospiraceae bacterium]|nr:glucosyltransferase domain-containing protein [Lachnospiraceae bacterium]